MPIPNPKSIPLEQRWKRQFCDFIDDLDEMLSNPSIQPSIQFDLLGKTKEAVTEIQRECNIKIKPEIFEKLGISSIPERANLKAFYDDLRKKYLNQLYGIE